MSDRLRIAQIRLNTLFLQMDINRFFQGGPTRLRVKQAVTERGELLIQNRELNDRLVRGSNLFS